MISPPTADRTENILDFPIEEATGSAAMALSREYSDLREKVTDLDANVARGRHQALFLEWSDRTSKKSQRGAIPQEESRGIDGYAGNRPVSIKPASYKAKAAANKKRLEATVVYYVTRIRFQTRHDAAVKAGKPILQSESVTLIDLDQVFREKAWTIFKKYRDQRLSFTNASSIAVMKKYGIGEVFAFDDDFKRLGFLRLPPK